MWADARKGRNATVARRIAVEAGSEIGHVLDDVGDSTVVLIRTEERFLVSRAPSSRVREGVANQARLLAAISETAGACSELDTEALKRDIRRQRGHPSTNAGRQASSAPSES